MKDKLQKLLAVFIMLIMVVSPFASAEIEGWQSALLDAFSIILDEYEEAYEEDADYEGNTYEAADEDNSGSYYEYDWPVTEPQQIVNYLFEYGCLPDNFITKNEAKKLGWDSSRNYVGEVAPDMSIGGDRFGNYEGLLPDKKGRTWYECDANYKGKKRGAERVVFSSDGLYYYTDDHYASFTEMFPEE